MRTVTYRLNHDLGFAPNPFFGWCTLACCMPRIRKKAQIGDIVVGMAGSDKAAGLGRIHPQIIYWMKVAETLGFDAYWADPRFAAKRPQANGPKMKAAGDRTYRHEAGNPQWRFDESMHYVPSAPQTKGGHVVTDTSVDRLLAGREFTYWGGSGPKLPSSLLGLFPAGRGHKWPDAGPLLDELHRFLRTDQPLGVQGDPADWDTPRYFKAAK